MENRTSKSYNYKTGKHHFSGLLNTAQHNYDLVLTEVYHRLGKTKPEKVKDIFENLFSSKDSFSTQEHVLTYMEEFFPWLALLRKKTDEQIFREESKNKDPNTELLSIKNTLYALYELLRDLRNEQTHYKHEAVFVSKEISETLNDLLFRIVKNVRKRCKEGSFRSYIVEKYKEEFEIDFPIKVKDKCKKEKECYVINKFFENYYIQKEKKEKGKEEKIEKLKRSTVKEKEPGKYILSNNGFVFFLSLFLGRKEMEDVMDHVTYFKDTRKLVFYLQRKTFSWYCFRDVRKSLRSDYSDDSLLMQMIEELYKCPGELYEVLSQKDKDEFLENINEYYNANPKTDAPEVNSVSHEVLRKRYQDKFPYFALRFMDKHFKFPTLRFQIALGEYVIDSRKKELSQLKSFEDRVISRRISYVGKLTDAEDVVKQKKIKVPGWKEYPNPYYKIENNRIPIYVELKGKLPIEGKTFNFKDLAKWKYKDIDKRTKKEIIGDQERRQSQLKDFGIANSTSFIMPNAFLSVHELPALLHAFLIDKKTGEEIEEIIKDKIKKQLTSIVEETCGKSNTPKGLKKILYGKDEIDLKKLRKDIDIERDKGEKIKEEVNKWLKLGNYQKTPTRNNNSFSKKYRGIYATWLAYDIKRFTGKDHIQDWKGYLFSELQTLLSLYSIRRKELTTLVNEHLKITTHPFLYKALSSPTLEAFICNYLHERQRFLEKLKEDDEKIFQYFEKRNYVTYPNKLKYFEELWKHPVNLNRGLLDDNGTVYNGNTQNAAQDTRAAWFTFAEESPRQQFYGFTRTYIDEKITRTVYLNGKTKQQPIKFSLSPQKGFMEQVPTEIKMKYQEDRGKVAQEELQHSSTREEKKHPEINSFIKNAYKNEQNIRRISRTDVYLYEMIKYWLHEMPSDSQLEFPALDQVWLTKDQRKEQIIQALEQSSKNKGDNSENKLKADYLLSFPILLTLFDGTIVEKVKVKDVGRFRKLEKDERAKTLIEYYNSGLWKKESSGLSIKDIETELESYHKIRVEHFFEVVHRFENEIYNKTSDDYKHKLQIKDEKSGKMIPNFRTYITFFFIPKEDMADFDEINFKDCVSLEQIPNRKHEYDIYYLLCIIRNKFCHNQLPSSEIYNASHNFLRNSYNTLAEYYYQLYEHFYKIIYTKYFVEK